MEGLWTRFMSALAVCLVTSSFLLVVGANGYVLQKTKDASPNDIALGKVLELLQLMESKLEKNAKEVQVETVEVDTRASILKQRVGKPANPSQMEFDGHKVKKTVGPSDKTAANRTGGAQPDASSANVTSGRGQSEEVLANLTINGSRMAFDDASVNATSVGGSGTPSETTPANVTSVGGGGMASDDDSANVTSVGGGEMASDDSLANVTSVGSGEMASDDSSANVTSVGGGEMASDDSLANVTSVGGGEMASDDDSANVTSTTSGGQMGLDNSLANATTVGRTPFEATAANATAISTGNSDKPVVGMSKFPPAKRQQGAVKLKT